MRREREGEERSSGDDWRVHAFLYFSAWVSPGLSLRHCPPSSQRFFKGASRGVEGALNSFRVA